MNRASNCLADFSVSNFPVGANDATRTGKNGHICTAMSGRRAEKLDAHTMAIVEFVLSAGADYNRPSFFNDPRILKLQSAWKSYNSHAN
jgi:hypothetical protein